MRRLLAVVALAAVCLASGPALGQPPHGKTPEEEAKEQYERGVVAYNLERFDDAIAAFTRAYELDPAPTLPYNIAQARWKKGENERALFYYRRYLEADPTTENRARVEARIHELEGAGARPTPLAAPAPKIAVVRPPPVYVQASAAAPAPPPALYRRPWFWGVVGGAAAVTVAAVLLASSKSPHGGCTSLDCNLGIMTVPRP